MKRTTTIGTLLLAAALHAGVAMAVPAYPWKMSVKQPDGSLLTIQKQGDEHASMTFTADGYPLCYDEARGIFEYGRIEQGTLVSTGVAAADASRRTPEQTALLATVDSEAARALLCRQQAAAMRKAQRKVLISDIPTTGKQKSLVILVEFSDRSFSMTDPHDFYHEMLNAEGYTNKYGATGSARDFYVENSRGAYEPDFVVVGPVKLPRSYSYYGANMTQQSGIDYQIYEFVHDAAAAADSLVDYSQFDSDADGKVDNIYFFYAGYGEADSGASNTIWPHSANYYDDFEETLICDGMYINRYACSQELSGQRHQPVGIGTFVHEYGHVLGLVDHYNTQNQQAGGPGLWDTMANGSYLNNQHTPPLFSAFERAELGWLTYTDLTTDADSINVVAPLSSPDEAIAYRWTVPGTDGREYFIIENRQQQGWDSYLPGHGLLVWHIDMDEQLWWQNKANADPAHQHIDLIEADRTPDHDGGDAFPGTKNVTQFSFEAWSGDVAFGFDFVDETDEKARFLLSGTAFSLPVPQVTVSGVMGRSALVAWTPVADAAAYDVTVSNADGAAVSRRTLGADTCQLLVEGLQPETAYAVSVVARLAGYASAEQPVPFATTELQYVEKQVEVLPATGVEAGAFTANWSPLEATDNYVVSLFRSEMSGRDVMCWDFTGQSESRPEGWSTSGSRYDNNYYGEAAPSLRLSKDGDYLLMSCRGHQLSRLSFWYRASSDGNQLAVEQHVGGQWQQVGDMLTVAAASAATAHIALDAADSVRIVFHKKANYVQIDDVVCEYIVEELQPVGALSDVSVGAATHYRFAGLPAGSYAYSVVGQSADGTTLPSLLERVQLSGDPQGINHPVNADAARRESTAVCDLQGRRMGSESLRKGLYIHNGRKFVVR